MRPLNRNGILNNAIAVPRAGDDGDEIPSCRSTGYRADLIRPLMPEGQQSCILHEERCADSGGDCNLKPIKILGYLALCMIYRSYFFLFL